MHHRVSLVLIVLVAAALQPMESLRGEHVAPSEFKVEDGMEVSVWATTPQLYNPTNFDIDAQGRVWVTEALNYRNFRNEPLGLSQEDGDRVVVLEDTDNDGKADASHTFVRDPDLVAPLGIGVIDNQVIVSCAPNILIYTDVNRDARFDPNVDKKEVFLTGFRGLDHDHSLHSVKAGPDGMWYFNVGNAGPHTVTDRAGWTLRAGSSYAGGTPHLKQNTPGRKSDDGRVWVGGVALRIRSDGTGLEPIAHNFRNAYEESISSFGDIFHSDNDDPPACRTTWIMEGGNAGFSSADGERAWKADQRPGQTVRVAEWRQEDPGVMPAGDVYGNGAPTGNVFCENGCFDQLYPDGLFLSCDSALGDVMAYVPKPQGAGFALERFSFMQVKNGSASKGWFRPSDVAVGTDGAIYVSDWYDPGVGGHRMSDETGSGTIYRIAPRGYSKTSPELNLSDPAGQISALMSPAVNVRVLGFNALRSGGSRSLPLLRKLLEDSNLFLSARAAWLLPYLGDEGIESVRRVIRDDRRPPQLRIAALRAIRRAAKSPMKTAGIDQVLSESQKLLASDASAAVRREVAISLRDVPLEKCSDLVTAIAERYDGWDRWYLEALGTACDGEEAEAYELLVSATGVPSLQWDRRLAGIAWRLHPSRSIDSLLTRAMAKELSPSDRKSMINAIGFVANRDAAEGMLKLATEGPEDLRGLAAWWGKSRHKNRWKAFGLGDRFPTPPPVRDLKKNTRPKYQFEITGEAVYTGAGGDSEIEVDLSDAKRLYLMFDSDSPESIQGTWVAPRLQHPRGDVALDSLEWSMAFTGDLPAYYDAPGRKAPNRRPKLLGQPTVIQAGDAGSAAGGIRVEARSGIAYDIAGSGYTKLKVTARVDSKFSKVAKHARFSIFVDRTPLAFTSADGESQEASAFKIDALLKMKGNPTLGRALFLSDRLGCAKCHTAEGFGGEIGPELTLIARKHAKPVLFEGILNPNAAIATGFETMSVLTIDGLAINGLMVSAGDPIVLKDASGKIHSIAQDDVDVMRNGKTSIMPDLKAQLTAEEVASLVAYLQSMADASSGM